MDKKVMRRKEHPFVVNGTVYKDYDGETRIADRRKELGLTQDELADRIGIGRQALSIIENGGKYSIKQARILPLLQMMR